MSNIKISRSRYFQISDDIDYLFTKVIYKYVIFKDYLNSANKNIIEIYKYISKVESIIKIEQSSIFYLELKSLF